MPRKLLLTAEKIETICQLVESGVLPDTAARFCGIASRTMDTYLLKGRLEFEAREKDDAPDDVEESLFCQLYRRLEQSKAKIEAVILTQIRLAAQGIVDAAGKTIKAGDWKAGTWLLEKMRPLVYASTNNIAVTMNGRVKHEVEGRVDVHHLTDDALDEQIDAINARIAELQRAEGQVPPELPVLPAAGPPPDLLPRDEFVPPEVGVSVVADEPPPNLATVDPQAEEDAAWFTDMQKLSEFTLKTALLERAVRERYYRVKREVESRKPPDESNL